MDDIADSEWTPDIETGLRVLFQMKVIDLLLEVPPEIQGAPLSTLLEDERDAVIDLMARFFAVVSPGLLECKFSKTHPNSFERYFAARDPEGLARFVASTWPDARLFSVFLFTGNRKPWVAQELTFPLLFTILKIGAEDIKEHLKQVRKVQKEYALKRAT
ncbi:hypothetical protein NHN26_15890 [Rhodovulum tesquicola]|uniref:hypothetical protein n=1 Tax=Rhodovulum tesquicola TaxID=540254 RepID=UPI002096BBEB|nr:hypothetical protein [Rhodovulum tesquicola]MCO8146695.1 hypothetical protein [Rhodovulum tesquicola]